MDFYKKYIKYKTKYLRFKEIQTGGSSKNDIILYISDNFNAILDRLSLEPSNIKDDIYRTTFIDISDNSEIESMKHTMNDNKKYLIEYIYGYLSSVDPSGLKYCKYIINMYTYGEILWNDIANKLYYNLTILNLFQFKLFKDIVSIKKALPPGKEYDDINKLNKFVNLINKNKGYSLETLIDITDINLLNIYGPSIFSYDELYNLNNIIPTPRSPENSSIYKDKLYEFMQGIYAQLGELSGELNEIEYEDYTDKEELKIKMEKLFDRHNKITKPLAGLKYLLIKYTGTNNNTKYLNNGTIIISPKDRMSSIFFGRGTQWCTSGIRNNLFHSYSENGIHIVINILSGYKTQVGITMIANEQDERIENEVFGSTYPYLFIDEEQVKKFKYDKKVQYTPNDTYDENIDCNKNIVKYVKSNHKSAKQFKKFKHISISECGNIANILELAVKHGAFDILKLLASKGVDLNVSFSYNPNLFFVLAQDFNKIISAVNIIVVEQMVKLLVEHGVDINKEHDMRIPLYYAINGEGKNKTKLVGLLLDNGATVNNHMVTNGNFTEANLESDYMRKFMKQLDREQFSEFINKLQDTKNAMLAIKFIKIITKEEFYSVYDKFKSKIGLSALKYVNKSDLPNILEKYISLNDFEIIKYLLDNNVNITDVTIKKALNISNYNIYVDNIKVHRMIMDKDISDENLKKFLYKYIFDDNVENVEYMVKNVIRDRQILTDDIINTAAYKEDILEIFIDKGITLDQINRIMDNLSNSNNIQLLDKLIKNGANVTDSFIRSSSYEYNKFKKLIIDNNIMLNGDQLQTVMYTHNEDAIKLALEQFYDKNIMTNILDSYIHGGYMEIIYKLIEKGAKITDTVMNSTIFSNNVILMKYILDNGREITNENINSIVYAGNILMLRLVLDKFKEQGKNVDNINTGGVVSMGNIDALNVLHEYSVNFNKEIETDKHKYLSYSLPLAYAKNEQVMMFLIKNGMDINARTREGYSALHIFVMNSILYEEHVGIDVNLVKTFAKFGANFNNKNTEGVSILNTIVSIIHESKVENSKIYHMIKALIDNGMDIDEKDSSGKLLLTSEIMEKIRMIE